MSIVSNIIIGINSVIFFCLAIIHVYWAFGGKFAFSSSIPKTSNGELAFKPGIFMTLIVAFGLFIFGLSTISGYGIFHDWIDSSYFRIIMWAIVIIFYLRAIGDFKLIGLTKKLKNTEFGIRDTKIFTPLCLYLATSSLLLIIS